MNFERIPETIEEVTPERWSRFFRESEVLLGTILKDTNFTTMFWSRNDALAFQRYFGIADEDVEVTSARVGMTILVRTTRERVWPAIALRWSQTSACVD